MSATAAVNHDWSRGRWWAAILLLLLLQGGFIFWLSFRRHEQTAITFPPQPVVVSSVEQREWPLLNDASRFVLANPHGFSQKAWMQLPALQYELPEWTEAPLPLALAADRLGGALFDLVQNDLGATFQLFPMPDPQIEAALPPDPVPPARSRVTLEGVLSDRQLLSNAALPAWQSADILTNSVVQTGVNEKGTVVSAVLLNSCGLPKADNHALMVARSARFEPLNPGVVGSPSARLQWGNMVFRWQTLATPTNNAASHP